MDKLSFKAVAAVAWLLAIANYLINNPWDFFGSGVAVAINHSAGIFGTTTFALWLLVVGLAFRSYGRKAWWLILSAPLAMMTFLGLVFFVVASLIFPHRTPSPSSAPFARPARPG